MRLRVELVTIIFCSIILSVACQEASSPSPSEPAHPIQILNFDDDTKTVTLVEGSLERLFLNPQVSDREVVIVSIAGALRKGKSFLLNYMLRYLYANYRFTSNPTNAVNESERAQNEWLGDKDEPLRGFSWKSSTKRETTGILFWSDVFLYDSPNNEKIAIYLVDTQGLFDHLSTPTDNIRIFSLSALISSVQLMNIFNVIQESDLEYMQYATEVARFTAVDDQSQKPFQRLIFVIRDWGSPDEFDYGLEGGRGFINAFLKIRDFHTEELKKVRLHMQKTFESVDGFLMPHPGKAVARNSSYDGHWGAIDEDFVEALEELVPLLLAPKNLVTKTVNGVPVRAFELSVYIKQYVELFKSESLPEAKSIYESTLDNQFQLLMSKCVELYLESIQLYQDKISSEAEIDQLHNVSMAISVRYFESEKKFGNDQESFDYKKELEGKLEKAYEEWRPISLEFLSAIKTEQDKTDKQKALAKEAKERDLVAKKNVEDVDRRYQQLQLQINQLRFESDEAKKAAEARLAQVERERNEALARHSEERRKYEAMRAKAAESERQLLRERQEMQWRLNQQVAHIRKRDGFSQFFHDVGAAIGAVIGAVKGAIFGQ